MTDITEPHQLPAYHAGMTLVSFPRKVEHESFADIVRTLVPEIPDPVLSSLESIHELRFYHAGTVILKEGTASEGIVVLCSGVVSVSLKSPVGVTVKLREIAAPAILGLSETMLGQTFQTTVMCDVPAQAVFLPARHFIRIMRQFPSASIQFSGLVSEELSATYARLAELRRTPPSVSR